jgi:guanylate kinase
MTMRRRGLLIILSSPSGAGKSTLAKRLRAWDPSIRFSVSATTRPARPGEVDGTDYHFVTEPDFKRLVREGEMLEHAHVFGNFYGSPRGPVQAAIDEGADVLFDIDWQGAQQIRNSSLQEHVLSIFLLPPSIAELRARLIARGQDTDDTISRRMQRSWDEISHWDGYDYVLVNDNLDVTEDRLRTIVTAERLRRSQQPGLIEKVRSLQEEFEDGS